MAVQSIMPALGSTAPAFDLPIANPWVDDIDSPSRSLDNYPDARAFVVIFTCNHCPYAVHIEQSLVELASNFSLKGIQFIAICSNDATAYPADSFEKMSERARQINMPFPYLSDTSQDIAKAYGAACTPDIFVYDAAKTLKYRGRYDETRPRQGSAHGGELTSALVSILESGQAPDQQFPSIGCSIKWRAGNAPI